MRDAPMPQKYNHKLMRAALSRCDGRITDAARMVGCGYSTIRNWMNRHPELRALIEESREVNLDLAESRLLKRIRKDDLAAIIFYLKSQGKERGYGQSAQVEITGKDGGPVQLAPIIDLKQLNTLTTAQIRALTPREIPEG